MVRISFQMAHRYFAGVCEVFLCKVPFRFGNSGEIPGENLSILKTISAISKKKCRHVTANTSLERTQQRGEFTSK